jgi:hypothetical protein
MPDLRPDCLRSSGIGRYFPGGDRGSSLHGRLDQMIGRSNGASGVPPRARPLLSWVLSCVRSCAQSCAALTLALGLAGCGSISDEAAGRAMMAPGRYGSFPCPNIDERIQAVRTRRIELEQLMARSSQSAGGEFVNAIAYRSEYVQTGGELQELARAAADKKCAAESQYSSGRQVY